MSIKRADEVAKGDTVLIGKSRQPFKVSKPFTAYRVGNGYGSVGISGLGQVKMFCAEAIEVQEDQS